MKKIVVTVPVTHADQVRGDSLLKSAVSAIKEVHPYEEVALDVYNLETYDN